MYICRRTWNCHALDDRRAEVERGKRYLDTRTKSCSHEISAYANLRRLTEQREAFRKNSWTALAKNYETQVYSISSICKKQPKNMHIIN